MKKIEKKHRHLREASNAYDTTSPLHTFSIGIAGSPDLVAARSVAEHLGTAHHEFTFTPQEALDAFPVALAPDLARGCTGKLSLNEGCFPIYQWRTQGRANGNHRNRNFTRQAVALRKGISALLR